MIRFDGTMEAGPRARRPARRGSAVLIGMLVLAFASGCERTVPEDSSKHAAQEASPSEKAAPVTGSAKRTPPGGPGRSEPGIQGTRAKAGKSAGTSAAPARRTGRVRTIVISDVRIGGTTCMVTDPPQKHIGLGDEVRWVSKTKKHVTIDINGTSPMARGHFDLEPGGATGGIVLYDGTRFGARTFHYSIFPRNCSGGTPALVADVRKP